MTFLEQLQQSAGLLSNDIASVGFYTPQQTDFIDGVARNQFMGNQFLMPGLSLAPGQQIPVFGGTMGSGLLNYSPGSFTYTPQPFQSNYFQNVPMTSPAIARTTTRTGGQGEGRDRAAQMAADRALRDEIAQYGFQIPGYEEPTLPGLLGIVESVIDNLDREARIADIARDVKASKDFGVNRFGLGTSYKGSGGTDTSGGATPDTGPSGVDADTGKFSGGKQKGSGGNTGGNTSGGGGFTGGGFCFDPNTLVEMLDGTEKPIKNIKLGDKTKGGEVTGVFQFKASDEIHNYKGVTVAGSHYVKEDGKFIMVQDSPISFKIDKIPVVHSLDTTERRIWIKGIEFADYNGDGIAKEFLHNAGVDLTGFDKEVLRQVEDRLI